MFTRGGTRGHDPLMVSRRAQRRMGRKDPQCDPSLAQAAARAAPTLHLSGTARNQISENKSRTMDLTSFSSRVSSARTQIRGGTDADLLHSRPGPAELHR